MKVLRDEAVLVVAVLQAALVLAGAFGLDLSAEQVAAITGFFSAVLAVVVRSVVSSPTAVATVATDAATRTAEKLTADIAGIPGQVVPAAQAVVDEVVGDVLKGV